MENYFSKQDSAGLLFYVVENEYNGTVYKVMEKYPFEEDKYDFIKYNGVLPVFRLKEKRN